MNLDFLVNSKNVLKQRIHKLPNVPISTRSIAAVLPIKCATKPKLTNYHVAGAKVMNLLKEI